MEEINPYAAPQTELVSSESRPTANPLRTLDWFAWATVFALNLIVPVLGGLQVLQNPGQWTSMLVGIICVFMLSCWKIARAPQYYAEWMKNGIFMVYLQLLPALHLIIGFFAVLFCGWIENLVLSNKDWHIGIQTWLGGFVTTIVIGLIMIGFMLSFIRDDNRRKNRMQKSKAEH